MSSFLDKIQDDFTPTHNGRAGDIITMGGKDYKLCHAGKPDPLYPVRNYQPLDGKKLTLENYYAEQIALIESFQRRLMKYAEGNINSNARYVDENRQRFEASQHRLEEVKGGKKRVTPDTIFQTEVTRTHGAQYAVSLFNRMCDSCIKAIKKERKLIHPEDANRIFDSLEALEEERATRFAAKQQSPTVRKISKDLMALSSVQDNVHHYHQRPQVEEVKLGEFFGEPAKIVTNGLSAFYGSRFTKIAVAMKSIDELKDGLCDLAASTLGDSAREFVTNMHHLAAYAKKLTQIKKNECGFNDDIAYYNALEKSVTNAFDEMAEKKSIDLGAQGFAARISVNEDIRSLATIKTILGDVLSYFKIASEARVSFAPEKERIDRNIAEAITHLFEQDRGRG